MTKLVPAASVPPAYAPNLATSSGGRISILSALLDRDKTTREASLGSGLLAGADIIVCDRVVDDAGLPRDLAKYVRLVERHDEGVWVTTTAFGLTGPYSKYLGSELVSSAAGGLAATIAPRDGGRPSLLPGFQGLLATGQVAALAALHGLDRRRETGRPVHVDVSAQEAVAMLGALPECAHAIYACPGRAGSGRYVAPSGLFRCRNGFVRITAPDDHQWAGLVRALGTPGWTRGFEGREARATNAEAINREIESWTAAFGIHDCAERLQAHGVPATPVNTPDDLLASPQLASRGFLESAKLGDVAARLPGRPYTWTPSASQVGDTDANGAGLRRLRVAEFTHVLAAPIAGALLGAMGAQVVRFEDLARLDLYRRTGPFAHGVPGKERGAYFAVSNHSKRSIAVDVEAEPEAAPRLACWSDVVLENFGSKRMARLGVAAEASARRDLLFVSISGFGQSGPLAGYRAYANNVHAYGGLSHLTRAADGAPLHVGTVIADPLSALTAATVIAAWALGRRRHGGVVDLSMAEVVADKVGEFIAEASLAEKRTIPAGSDRPPHAPHGFHPTADGRWIAISVQSDSEWRALVEALGNPEILREPSWSDESRRWETRRTIESALDELTRKVAANDLFHSLQRAGVRACPAWSGADLVEDPHLRARGFFPRVDHPDPDLAEAKLVGLAWRFVGGPAIPLQPPPRLGECTLEDLPP